MNIENNSSISGNNYVGKINLPKGEKTDGNSSIFEVGVKKITEEDIAKILENLNLDSNDENSTTDLLEGITNEKILQSIQDYFKENTGDSADKGKLPKYDPDNCDPGFDAPRNNSGGRDYDIDPGFNAPRMTPNDSTSKDGNNGVRTLPDYDDAPGAIGELKPKDGGVHTKPGYDYAPGVIGKLKPGNNGVETMPYIIDPSKPKDIHVTLLNNTIEGFNLSEEDN